MNSSRFFSIWLILKLWWYHASFTAGCCRGWMTISCESVPRCRSVMIDREFLFSYFDFCLSGLIRVPPESMIPLRALRTFQIPNRPLIRSNKNSFWPIHLSNFKILDRVWRHQWHHRHVTISALYLFAYK